MLLSYYRGSGRLVFNWSIVGIVLTTFAKGNLFFSGRDLFKIMCNGTKYW